MPRPPKAPSADQPEFGRRLQRALEHAKLSRGELAERLGVQVQSIGQVINGPTVAMTASNCAKAARILGVSGYWLATGEGPMVEPAPEPVLQARYGEAKFLDVLRVLEQVDRDEIFALMLEKVMRQRIRIAEAVETLAEAQRQERRRAGPAEPGRYVKAADTGAPSNTLHETPGPDYDSNPSQPNVRVRRLVKDDLEVSWLEEDYLDEPPEAPEPKRPTEKVIRDQPVTATHGARRHK